jgi:hypothetical protein
MEQRKRLRAQHCECMATFRGDGSLPEKARELVEEVCNSGERRNRLVELLLDVLPRSTATFPAEPIGAGARWSVVEPLDARVLRSRAEEALVTTYRVGGVLPPRAHQLHRQSTR